MGLAGIGPANFEGTTSRAEADAIVKAHMKKTRQPKRPYTGALSPLCCQSADFIGSPTSMEVIAPRTFKGPHIGVGGTKFDASQLHVALALGATWPFDGKQRRAGTSMRFSHVMRP